MAVSLEDNRANIDSVLKQIPEMFANNRHGSPVGTAAVKACIEALKPHGGRVLAFMVSFFYIFQRAISMTSCLFVFTFI
jgi:protein transport protein SEC24